MQPQCRSPTAGTRRPHLLHIVVDDLGHRDLGFNNPERHSPNIDHLRACGVVLDHFYAPKACAPSRASIMTGRYPFHVGVYSNVDVDTYGVPTNFTFLPELLRRHAGYATHAVGKWHLGHRSVGMTPTYRGFDSFFGFWHCCSDYHTHTFPGGGLDLTRANGTQLATERGHAGEYSAAMYADVASAIIRSHPRGVPLYLYLAFQSVHGPYQVPSRYRHAQASAHPAWSAKRQTYAAMVAAMDAAVGQVVRTLRGAKLWEASLVLLMSDNGGALGMMQNEPLRGGKFTLWEGGVRVPFLLSGPVMFARRGGRWDGLSHTSDILPTLLAAAGAAAAAAALAPPLDGVSLWAALLSNASSPRREVIHQVVSRWSPRDCLGADHDAQNCGAALRVGRYKLLAGYPGDARDSAEAADSAAWEPDYAAFPSNASLMARSDGCRLADGARCRCWRAACLFDVVADPSEAVELSGARPRLAALLARRLAEASLSASQGAAACAAARAADAAAARRMYAEGGAHLPFAAEAAWRDEREAPSCYNGWHAAQRSGFGIGPPKEALAAMLNGSSGGAAARRGGGVKTRGGAAEVPR
ncbi:hypothetical protein AB1Y20_002885 [Prymnesium parvum]|uniref:Sulfatase N-terminal domain-containing protein n=1 Tax=Prymnesium parvum TaxID=97485 RepID=A0AB34JBP7_PRYPA